MNIFGGRPGIAAGVLAVIAILAAAYLTLSVNVTLLISALVFVALCIVLCACKYITPYRLFANCVVALIFLAALLRGIVTFYVDAPEAEALCGENKYVHATVTERLISSDYYTAYIVRIHSIGGVEYDGKAVLNCEYNSELQKGYEFVLRNAVVNYVMRLADNEAISFIADNVFLTIDTEKHEDYVILSEGNFTFSDNYDRINSFLSAKLKNRIRGEEGKLAAAMLLGDKESLTSLMYRDFTRAGLSHYLAVSGLHVSIITGVVSFFLMQLKIKRQLRNLLIGIFALTYLLLLGFPISAVRSVIMLLTVFFAYSMGDSADSLNSLGIAAVIIVLIEPWAVFDKSFILSFGATLGVVSFMPVFNDLVNRILKRKRKDGKEEKKSVAFGVFLLRKAVTLVFGTLMCVSAALSLTLLPIMYIFGETSVLGYRSNLYVVLAGPPLIGASLFYLFLGDVPYIGEALETVIRKTARYILDIASKLSAERGALVSLVSKKVAMIVILFSILILIVLVVKFKYKKLLLLVPLSYPIVIFVIILTAAAVRPIDTVLTFISTGKDEVILVEYHDGATVVDISDGSLARMHLVTREAEKAGITEFDTLILTHYHTKHLSSVTRFISEERVYRVILPYPQHEDDAWIMAQLVDSVQSVGAVCEIAAPFAKIELQRDTALTLSDISLLKRSDHPIIYLSFADSDERVTYVGESSWENGISALGELIAQSDVLYFGGHGPLAKLPFDVPAESAKYVVLTDPKLAKYVLPYPSCIGSIDGIIGAEIWKYTFNNTNY